MFAQPTPINNLFKWRKKSFKDGQVSATIDDCADVTLNGETYYGTVRSASCEMLVPNGKCSNRVPYRASLLTACCKSAPSEMLLTVVVAGCKDRKLLCTALAAPSWRASSGHFPLFLVLPGVGALVHVHHTALQ